MHVLTRPLEVQRTWYGPSIGREVREEVLLVCFFPFSLQTCFLFCEDARDLEGWSLEASEPGCVMGVAMAPHTP